MLLERGNLGWLLKQGRKVRSWKRRWGVCDAEEGVLKYYTDPSRAVLKGSIPLVGASVSMCVVSSRLAPKGYGAQQVRLERTPRHTGGDRPRPVPAPAPPRAKPATTGHDLSAERVGSTRGRPSSSLTRRAAECCSPSPC